MTNSATPIPRVASPRPLTAHRCESFDGAIVDHYDHACTSPTRTDRSYRYNAGSNGRDGTYLIDGASYSHGAAWRHLVAGGLTARTADLYLAQLKNEGQR